MNTLKTYFTLPKRIFAIALSTMINRVGGLVGPFLTLLLAQQLKMDAFSIGLYSSLSLFFSFVGTLIGGRMIDHLGSKYTRIIFHGIHGLIYLLCTALFQTVWVLPLLILASFMTGIQAPTASTLVYENVAKEQVREAFSLNYIAINIGFSVGPLLAAYLYKNHLIWLFLGDGITSLLSIALIFLAVPNHRPSARQDVTKKGDNLLTLLVSQPVIAWLILVNMLYFIAFSQMTYGMPLAANATFGEFGVTLYGYMLITNGIMCFALTPLITIISKRFSTKHILICSGILYALGFSLYGYTSVAFIFIAATALWTIGEILGAITFDAYVIQNAPEHYRGRAASLAPLARRVGMMIGPTLGGFINLHYGLQIMWTAIAVFPLLGAWLLYKKGLDV